MGKKETIDEEKKSFKFNLKKTQCNSMLRHVIVTIKNRKSVQICSLLPLAFMLSYFLQHFDLDQLFYFKLKL